VRQARQGAHQLHHHRRRAQGPDPVLKKPGEILLGFGNEILGDDAVGLLLSEEIGRALGIETSACSMYGFEILSRIEGRDRLFIIDSVVAPDVAPGEVRRYSLETFRDCRHLASPHSANFAAGIEFGRASGLAMPDEIVIYGVTTGAIVEFSESLTPELTARYPAVRQEILEDIRRIRGT
jgi:hydrogenase maturation protease